MSTAPLGVRQELARKAIHLTAAAAPIAYAAGMQKFTLIITLGALAAAAVLVEVSRRTSRVVQQQLERLFGRLFRAHERASTTGATWLLIGMFAATALLSKPLAISTMWAAAVGDPAAALVGRPFGRIRFSPNGKSLEGSLACLATTALGAVLLGNLRVWEGVVAGAIAAAAEWPRLRIDDNIRVALAVGGTLFVLRMFVA